MSSQDSLQRQGHEKLPSRSSKRYGRALKISSLLNLCFQMMTNDDKPEENTDECILAKLKKLVVVTKPYVSKTRRKTVLREIERLFGLGDSHTHGKLLEKGGFTGIADFDNCRCLVCWTKAICIKSPSQHEKFYITTDSVYNSKECFMVGRKPVWVHGRSQLLGDYLMVNNYDLRASLSNTARFWEGSQRSGSSKQDFFDWPKRIHRSTAISIIESDYCSLINTASFLLKHISALNLKRFEAMSLHMMTLCLYGSVSGAHNHQPTRFSEINMSSFIDSSTGRLDIERVLTMIFVLEKPSFFEVVLCEKDLCSDIVSFSMEDVEETCDALNRSNTKFEISFQTCLQYITMLVNTLLSVMSFYSARQSQIASRCLLETFGTEALSNVFSIPILQQTHQLQNSVVSWNNHLKLLITEEGRESHSDYSGEGGIQCPIHQSWESVQKICCTKPKLMIEQMKECFECTIAISQYMFGQTIPFKSQLSPKRNQMLVSSCKSMYKYKLIIANSHKDDDESAQMKVGTLISLSKLVKDPLKTLLRHLVVLPESKDDLTESLKEFLKLLVN